MQTPPGEALPFSTTPPVEAQVKTEAQMKEAQAQVPVVNETAGLRGSANERVSLVTQFFRNLGGQPGTPGSGVEGFERVVNMIPENVVAKDSGLNAWFRGIINIFRFSNKVNSGAARLKTAMESAASPPGVAGQRGRPLGAALTIARLGTSLLGDPPANAPSGPQPGTDTALGGAPLRT